MSNMGHRRPWGTRRAALVFVAGGARTPSTLMARRYARLARNSGLPLLDGCRDDDDYEPTETPTNNSLHDDEPSDPGDDA